MKDTQLALVDGKALTQRDVMSAMEMVVTELHQTGDIQKTTKVLNVLERIEETSGHAKAVLLYGMNQWWDKTGQGEKRNDTFEDYVESNSSTKAIMVTRYVRVQTHIESLDIPKEFHQRPMRELIPVANALHQGYEIGKEQWNDMRVLRGEGAIRQFINEKVKGKKPRKSALNLVLERDGSINLWKGNKRKFVGHLAIDDTDPDVIKAIARIVDNAQIRRK